MSTDRKDVYIDQKAVDEVDQRIRQSAAMTKGVMSSWSNPMEGVVQGPLGKITAPKPKTPDEVRVAPVVPHGMLVRIPPQAMKAFKKLITYFMDVEVKLNPDQKKLFLEHLESMSTPKNMMDAEAIFTLMKALR